MVSATDLRSLRQQVQECIRQGAREEATRLCDAGLKHTPGDPGLRSARARLHFLAGELDQALAESEAAMAAAGRSLPDLVVNHGEMLLQLKRRNEAEALTREALGWAPHHRRLLQLHAKVLTRNNRRQEALEVVDGMLARESSAELVYQRALLQHDLGALHASQNSLEEMRRLNPDSARLHATLLFHSHYQPELGLGELLKRIAEWHRDHTHHLPVTTTFDRDQSPDRPLRIGFVSSGFQLHPAGTLSFGVLSTLRQFFDHELYLYHTAPEPQHDELNPAFRALAHHWRSLLDCPDDQLHQILLEDELDILVDMTGHTGHSALLALARRAAPIQVKWVGGLFNTSGVATMDYLLTDWIETPEGAEAVYAESLVRLPGGYVTYRPPTYLPEVNPSPAMAKGFVTFGCLNKTHKLNEVIAREWAGVLKAVPGSRLLISDRMLADPGVREHVVGLFEEAGLDRERLELRPGGPQHEFLRTYHDIDIALDPWPYSGGLTTVEALYMGVPTVTCPGPSFAGRHAASHLHNAGLGQLIARDFEDYRAKAKALAAEPRQLAALRSGLRKRCTRSPLGNHLQFAANLDKAFRLMWQRWLSGEPPGHINFQGQVAIPRTAMARAVASLKGKTPDQPGG